MLLVIGGAALLAVPVALILRRRLGWFSALAIAGFAWSLVAIAALTLVPAYGPPGYLQPDQVQTECSWDIGGPAPDGFWIFAGGQRAWNTALFIPSGLLLVAAVARWRVGWLLAPLGLVGLAGYSLAIEYAQLILARIARSCDITDVVDNVSGAVIGFLLGLLTIVVVRPWRDRRANLS